MKKHIAMDSPAMRPEDRFLLRLLFTDEKEAASTCRETIEDLDWQVFLRSARAEGVAGILFHHIAGSALEDIVKTGVQDSLRSAYYSNLKRFMTFYPELKKIFSRLHQAGIPFLVIKGIALAEQVYGHAALRAMSDADLLVRKEDVLKADTVLASAGYTPVDSRPERALKNPEGYLASLEYHKKGALPIHLHWHLVNTSTPALAFAGKIPMDRIWDRASRTQVAEVDALTLAPEHLLIYLCEHALRVGHSFDRLVLVCDIHRVLQVFGAALDWDLLVQESKAFGLSRFVYIALTIVGAYTGGDIPPAALRRLKPGRLFIGEKAFLALQLNNRRLRGSSYLVYLSAHRGLPLKIRFLFRTFFPPLQILRQRRHGPSPGHDAFFYFSRIREVARHALAGMSTFMLKKH